MAKTNSSKIKIEALNQVGLIVKDIEKTVKAYWDILGIGPHVIVTVEPVEGYAMTYGGRPAAYKFKASFCQVGAIELELIQSLEGRTLYDDHLRAHGEGANHLQSLAKSVEEVDRNVQILSGSGFPILMGGRYENEIAFAYADTVRDLKTIWEIVKMPAEPSVVPVIYPSSDQETSQARIKVKAINRIGLVVKDLEKVMESYRKILGIGPWEISELSSPELHDVTYQGKAVTPAWKTGVARSGPMELELIQPISGENIYSDFIEKQGEGIHHIQFLVDDLEETNRIMEEDGYNILMAGEHLDGGFAYYDTVAPLKIIWKACRFPGESVK